MSRCRACRAPIDWVTMRASGKKMPVDPKTWGRHALAETAATGPAIVLVTTHGTVVKGHLAKPGEASIEVYGWESHFATCKKNPPRQRPMTPPQQENLHGG
jgi:hypothetical protein